MEKEKERKGEEEEGVRKRKKYVGDVEKRR